jgi:hypothetical protein
MKLSRRELLNVTGKTAAAQAFGILGPIGCFIGRPQPALIGSRTSPVFHCHNLERRDITIDFLNLPQQVRV